MSILAQDNFNRADSTLTLGANWSSCTSDVQLDIRSNAVTFDLDVDSSNYYNAVTWPNDQWAQVEVTAGGGGSGSGAGGGPILRQASGANTRYRCVVNTAATNNIELAKFVTGTYTSLGFRTVTYGAGTVLYVEAQGATLVVKYGGVQAGASFSDAAITAGNAGLSYSGSTTTLSMENWSGGDFVAIQLTNPGTGDSLAPAPLYSGGQQG